MSGPEKKRPRIAEKQCEVEVGSKGWIAPLMGWTYIITSNPRSHVSKLWHVDAMYFSLEFARPIQDW